MSQNHIRPGATTGSAGWGAAPKGCGRTHAHAPVRTPRPKLNARPPAPSGEMTAQALEVPQKALACCCWTQGPRVGRRVGQLKGQEHPASALHTPASALLSLYLLQTISPRWRLTSRAVVSCRLGKSPDPLGLARPHLGSGFGGLPPLHGSTSVQGMAAKQFRPAPDTLLSLLVSAVFVPP